MSKMLILVSQIVLKTPSMPWPNVQNNTANYVKPYLSEADEVTDGSIKTPSRNTCLVIDKANCRMTTRGK